MRRVLTGAFAAAMLALVWSAGAAEPATKKTPPKKSTSAAKSTTKAKPTGTANRTATAKGSRKTLPKKPATTWRNRQNVPTAERYREIQGALASKGYLSADEANGAWGASSVDALKRFQADQNIDSSGKINSLSLIALGLGPKRDAAVVVPPPPPNDPIVH